MSDQIIERDSFPPDTRPDNWTASGTTNSSFLGTTPVDFGDYDRGFAMGVWIGVFVALLISISAALVLSKLRK